MSSCRGGDVDVAKAPRVSANVVDFKAPSHRGLQRVDGSISVMNSAGGPMPAQRNSAAGPCHVVGHIRNGPATLPGHHYSVAPS